MAAEAAEEGVSHEHHSWVAPDLIDGENLMEMLNQLRLGVKVRMVE